MPPHQHVQCKCVPSKFHVLHNLYLQLEVSLLILEVSIHCSNAYIPTTSFRHSMWKVLGGTLGVIAFERHSFLNLQFLDQKRFMFWLIFWGTWTNLTFQITSRHAPVINFFLSNFWNLVPWDKVAMKKLINTEDIHMPIAIH